MYDKTVYSWSLADMTRHLDPHIGGGLLQHGTHVRAGLCCGWCCNIRTNPGVWRYTRDYPLLPLSHYVTKWTKYKFYGPQTHWLIRCLLKIQK